ncbi:MAG TPA: chromosomal replication initiator protein DnaA [Candidatus Saccharimonadales bacterium]|nr:chromosomal replication initiator protein DnaA [Candidatus Saccharimonadales bacterium]
MQDGLWQAVLGEIELSISRASYLTWFKNTRLLRQKDNVLVVGVPNVFIKHQLESKYSQLVVDVLSKNGVNPEKVEYKIHSFTPIPDNEVDDGPLVNLTNQAVRTQTTTGGLTHTYRQGLNERYTFENFVVGSGNELAYAACQAITQLPGDKYNPLYLYGGVGIGKTHLIQAVGNSFKNADPNLGVVYISTEQFVQEFVDALRFKKTSEFSKHYRSADVLIVDDIQFIAGKEKMQEEFFHTFNALYQANKQIIVSSDRTPGEIPTLEDRLRSRFAWGMTIDMQTPDFETRCAIVQTKSLSHGVSLPIDVVEFLSGLVQSNVRELEGVLNQLLAFCEMRELDPSLAVATSLLNSKSQPRHVSPRQVVDRTARHFQISVDEILGPKRDKDIVVPRQVAMYILRSELHLSFPKIARELGRKDHTTAIHSIDKIEKELAFDNIIKSAVTEIKERLYA